MCREERNTMKNKKLSPSHAFTLTGAAILGTRVLELPYTAAVVAGNDGWISTLLAGILSIISGLILFKLVTLYPDKDLPQIVQEIGGKYLGKVLLIPLIVYTLLVPGFTIREFSGEVKILLLDKTPISVIMFILLLVIVLTLKKGITVLASCVDIVFPILIVVLILSLALSSTQAELVNIKPILFENTGNVLKGTLSTYGAYTGYGMITYVACHISDRKNLFKWFIAAQIVTGILITSMVLITLLVFGPTEIKTLVYPLLSLVKAVEFPATLFERLEILMVFTWIPSVFSASSIFCFASVRNILVLFNLESKYVNTVIYIHLLLLMAIAYFSGNVLQSEEYSWRIDEMALFIGLVFLPLLTIADIIKKKKEAKV